MELRESKNHEDQALRSRMPDQGRLKTHIGGTYVIYVWMPCIPEVGQRLPNHQQQVYGLLKFIIIVSNSTLFF